MRMNTLNLLILAVLLNLSNSFAKNVEKLPLEIQNKWEQLLKINQLNSSKQSLCFKNDDGVFSSNYKLKVRPASVSKLYTTLWSFEMLEKDHRFETQFFEDKDILYIKGGRDPFFVTENLLVAMASLKRNSFKKIVFDRNFYFNWTSDKKLISKKLKKHLNSNLWSLEFYKVIKNLEDYITNNRLDLLTPQFFEGLDIQFEKKFSVSDEAIKKSHFSSQLIEHFKQVNIYSNNFYTDQIFDYLGGSKKFHSYLYKKFKVDSSDTYFHTGSGLGENYTTCSTALKILDELKGFALKNNVALQDFISVAGSDEGTLKNRFKKDMANTVIAKTGTLRHTSTLAGFLGAKQKHSFAIFNHTWNKIKGRKTQNKIIQFYTALQPDISPFFYESKDYISILDAIIK